MDVEDGVDVVDNGIRCDKMGWNAMGMEMYVTLDYLFFIIYGGI